MNSDLQSQPADNGDAKTAFRKPTGDASGRKYRRHSPISESPSDGSPKHDRAASPKLSGEDSGRLYEDRSKRNDDRREIDRHSDRGHHGRGSDSYRHSDRHYSKSSHGYSRHDDYNRHDKHGDDERSHHRSSRSGWESRGETHSDHSRPRDHPRNMDKSRDKYDGAVYKSKDRERDSSFPEHQKYKDRDSSFEKAGPGRRHVHPEDAASERHIMEKDSNEDKRDWHRSSGDYRGDGKQRMKESYKSELKETGGQNLIKEGKKKYDDLETNRSKDQYDRDPADKSATKFVLGSENYEVASKKQKLSSEKDIGSGKRVSKFSSSVEADVKETSSKQLEDGKMPAQVNVFEVANDLDAAKVAAMKAAEMVNKNLVGGVGTGLMTADQKKKLLWGNKKATTAEEPGHRWDNAMFSDRERQEKFNKLMGLKGNQKVEHKPESEGNSDLLREEKQRELQLDLEKQYTAGLRRRDGRTVGLGL